MNTQQSTTYLTPQDLAERFGISLSAQALLRTKKRQMTDENPLPFAKIGRKIIYIADQIETWIVIKHFENSTCYKTEHTERLRENNT